MASPGVLESLEKENFPAEGEKWIVTVYDNPYNTYEEVIVILMIATQCSLEEAEMETWEIDHLGKSVVHRASEQECKHVAEIIRTIGIRVEETPDI